MSTDTTTPVAMVTGPQFATRAQYEALIAELGLSYIEQSGFLKVPGPKGYVLYVAATKTVRRIDVSGFEHGLGTLTKMPHCGVFGRVKQQIILDGTPDEQLARFRQVAEHMMTLAPQEPVAKAPKAKPADASSPGQSAASSPAVLDLSAITKRLSAIAATKRYAEMKGQTVSPKVLAEEADLIAKKDVLTTVAQADQA